MTHKDQKRVREALLPYLMDLTLSEAPQDIRDCTILNRALLQGPDPLFLMETCPGAFLTLCRGLRLKEDVGRDAIETAHWTGPGSLLDGQGLPQDMPLGDDIPEAWRKEALWLLLASVSDCEEGDYVPDISLMERFRRVTRAASGLVDFALLGGNPMIPAIQELNRLLDRTVFTPDARGIPVATVDAGHYVGYKLGHKVVGVRAGNKVFYGTVPGTTLAEQGIQVDVLVSPSYGFVRDPEQAP